MESSRKRNDLATWEKMAFHSFDLPLKHPRKKHISDYSGSDCLTLVALADTKVFPEHIAADSRKIL